MKAAGDAVEALAAATARERVLIAAHRGEPMDRPGDQLAALLDLCRALEQSEIKFAVIGSIAVGIHSATPRATNDVDVAVDSTVSGDDIRAALSEAGFEAGGTFPHSVNFKHSSGEPVQIAFDPAFDPMIARAEIVRVAGAEVPIVGREDLIAMKERAAADPAQRRSKALRDQSDIELLRGDVAGPDEGW